MKTGHRDENIHFWRNWQSNESIKSSLTDHVTF